MFINISCVSGESSIALIRGNGDRVGDFSLRYSCLVPRYRLATEDTQRLVQGHDVRMRTTEMNVARSILAFNVSGLLSCISGLATLAFSGYLICSNGSSGADLKFGPLVLSFILSTFAFLGTLFVAIVNMVNLNELFKEDNDRAVNV